MFWHNKTRHWQLLMLMGLAGTLLGLDSTSIASAILGQGQCESCHAQLAEERLREPTAWMNYDVHFKQQLGCADCHGGDPKAMLANEAHSPARQFVGQPDARDIPDLCARCHSDPQMIVTFNPSLPVDQLDKYKTSRHGQLLGMGLRKVAHCASCHTAHNIRPGTDPKSTVYPVNLPSTCNQCHGSPEYMAGFPIPTDQFAKYAASVHGVALLEGEDLGSPACNDCHGNHGAIPPGSQSLGHVCGICHTLNAQLFDQSPHAPVFALQELSQCTVCHNHHDIAPPTPDSFDMGAGSVCINCHKPDDAGWHGGKQMFALIAELRELEQSALAKLEEAHNMGMDVTDGEFLMQDFRKARLQIRTVSHSLNFEEFEAVALEARKSGEQAQAIALGAIDEFHIRRKGLLISLLLCFPVLVLLYIKIKILK